MVVAAILAAGSGSRFGRDKVWEPLGDGPLWLRTYRQFADHPEIARAIVVCAPDRYNECRALTPEAIVVPGGKSRQGSAWAAVDACPAAAEILILQDAARPFTSVELISRVIAATRRSGAAAAAVPVTDTIRDKASQAVLDRDVLVAMQTPQAAMLNLWQEAHAQANGESTDDIALLAAMGVIVELVEGEVENFKVTVPADLVRARAMLAPVETRTGLGYDVHRFSSDPARPLWLGGVHFEGRGLEGHSDADVVLHAAVDALLGAAALGDIGQHFPPSDPRWLNKSSGIFLRQAVRLLARSGWKVVNLDIAVIAEEPKIMPRAIAIRSAIAKYLAIESERVSIKATTNEGLGSIGRGEGIAAFATATIRKG